ncbi:unnamed protein product [Didymodactylos carnosus]|uniref:Uncharacterized protein n=1 Tax=Didymodactylos carnosus TaxID=1234261 RepID=A0A815HLV3_9BILA|nr:unnamed protein product [Didymodactylos carnosus]CAF1353505.1 unnamed protein product [Didymodactylos carnosus]CAF3995335.1 unnamed protein product [Didymodactylos carnosus]CAF4225608.1 unnamed protein product [Didymodactylos carnosus]
MCPIPFLSIELHERLRQLDIALDCPYNLYLLIANLPSLKRLRVRQLVHAVLDTTVENYSTTSVSCNQITFFSLITVLYIGNAEYSLWRNLIKNFKCLTHLSLYLNFGTSDGFPNYEEEKTLFSTLSVLETFDFSILVILRRVPYAVDVQQIKSSFKSSTKGYSSIECYEVKRPRVIRHYHLYSLPFDAKYGFGLILSYAHLLMKTPLIMATDKWTSVRKLRIIQGEITTKFLVFIQQRFPMLTKLHFGSIVLNTDISLTNHVRLNNIIELGYPYRYDKHILLHIFKLLPNIRILKIALEDLTKIIQQAADVLLLKDMLKLEVSVRLFDSKMADGLRRACDYFESIKVLKLNIDESSHATNMYRIVDILLNSETIMESFNIISIKLRIDFWQQIDPVYIDKLVHRRLNNDRPFYYKRTACSFHLCR